MCGIMGLGRHILCGFSRICRLFLYSGGNHGRLNYERTMRLQKVRGVSRALHHRARISFGAGRRTYGLL